MRFLFKFCTHPRLHCFAVSGRRYCLPNQRNRMGSAANLHSLWLGKTTNLFLPFPRLRLAEFPQNIRYDRHILFHHITPALTWTNQDGGSKFLLHAWANTLQNPWSRPPFQLKSRRLLHAVSYVYNWQIFMFVEITNYLTAGANNSGVRSTFVTPVYWTNHS